MKKKMFGVVLPTIKINDEVYYSLKEYLTQYDISTYEFLSDFRLMMFVSRIERHYNYYFKNKAFYNECFKFFYENDFNKDINNSKLLKVFKKYNTITVIEKEGEIYCKDIIIAQAALMFDIDFNKRLLKRLVKKNSPFKFKNIMQTIQFNIEPNAFYIIIIIFILIGVLMYLFK